MKLITWYVKFSLAVADLLGFPIRFAADVMYPSAIVGKHVFDIPKKWLTVSQPVRE